MEIKFRAWDKEEKEMVYDVQDTYDYRCRGNGALEESFSTVLMDKNRYEVMQYTGIKDCNGVELYDRDITVDDFDFKQWIIISVPGGFGICPMDYYKETNEAPPYWTELSSHENLQWFKYHHHIIGNKYQELKI